MKTHIGWSYRPYRPPFEGADIYICRIVPKATSIELFWLPCEENATYTVFCKECEAESFEKLGDTTACSFRIEDLATERDYDFYVACNGITSAVRKARTGVAVGTTVNYLHPQDTVYSFSGRFLCSPTLLVYPDGYLLTSMDLFEGGAPQNLTLLFGSEDNGKTWEYVSEVFPCFWGKPFLHHGVLYILGCSTEYGDLLIGAW